MNFFKNILNKLFSIVSIDEKTTDVLKNRHYQEEVIISPNSSKGNKPRFIVLHHSGGSFNGGISWIKQRKSKVSYHYFINPKNGDRVQFVWDNRKAWHAGESNWKGFEGLNDCSIGISFSGNTYKRNVSEIEIDSCSKKCLYIMNKFNMGIDSILTHTLISPGRKDDCSEEVRQRVLKRIEELQND